MKYHYTIGNYLLDIIKSGVLRVSTAATPRRREQAVWFSTNPLYEPTIAKMSLSMDGKLQAHDIKWTHDNCGGLVRIAIEDRFAPHSWNAYVRLSKMNKRFAEVFMKVGIEVGSNPLEWYCCFYPLQSKHWLSIERFDWNKQTWNTIN